MLSGLLCGGIDGLCFRLGLDDALDQLGADLGGEGGDGAGFIEWEGVFGFRDWKGFVGGVGEDGIAEDLCEGVGGGEIDDFCTEAGGEDRERGLRGIDSVVVYPGADSGHGCESGGGVMGL